MNALRYPRREAGTCLSYPSGPPNTPSESGTWWPAVVSSARSCTLTPWSSVPWRWWSAACTLETCCMWKLRSCRSAPKTSSGTAGLPSRTGASAESVGCSCCDAEGRAAGPAWGSTHCLSTRSCARIRPFAAPLTQRCWRGWFLAPTVPRAKNTCLSWARSWSSCGDGIYNPGAPSCA